MGYNGLLTDHEALGSIKTELTNWIMAGFSRTA
jgi:hypothetical protein